jgi:hypothetical protein
LLGVLGREAVIPVPLVKLPHQGIRVSSEEARQGPTDVRGHRAAFRYAAGRPGCDRSLCGGGKRVICPPTRSRALRKTTAQCAKHQFLPNSSQVYHATRSAPGRYLAVRRRLLPHAGRVRDGRPKPPLPGAQPGTQPPGVLPRRLTMAGRHWAPRSACSPSCRACSPGWTPGGVTEPVARRRPD